LDYIKLENGKTVLQASNFKLDEFLESTIQPLALMCHEKGLGLYIIPDNNVENSLIGDSTKLRQILVNLLNNAIKFTDLGEISIRVRNQNSNNQDDRTIVLEWEISDTGVGIPQDQLGKIFDPFVQADGSATRNAGGTGIGLSITKHLVELMHGNIIVKSTPNKGSVFTFSTQLHRGPRPSVINLPSFTSRSIILASSSQAWIESLDSRLRILGASILIVETADQLRNCLKQSTTVPLVIFHGTSPHAAEFVNPGSDPLLQKLRERKHIVSTRISKLEEQLWQTAGFTYDVLMEPIQLPLLYSLIQVLNEEYHHNQKDSAHANYRSSRPLKILYVEDDYLSSAVHAKLLESAGHQVNLANNGIEAVEELKKQPADLLILDIEMPQMNGFELASAIRSGELGPALQNLTMLALTAHSSNSDVKHAQLLGINAFLAKPFFPQSLLFTIDRIMSIQAVQSNVVAPPDFHETIKSKGLEPEHLIEIAGLIKDDKVNSAELILIDSRTWALSHEYHDLAGYLLKALFKLRRGDRQGAITILENQHIAFGHHKNGGKS
jgi:CheY-like chemotaxis protein